MSNKKVDERISIYEELSPNNGELLYALVEDDVEMFRRKFKRKFANLVMCEKELYDLLIESNSFGCFLYFQSKEKMEFNKKSVVTKKGMLKRVYLSRKLTMEEKVFFVENFLKHKFSIEEKIHFYLTSLIYAPTAIFKKYFQKYRKYMKNEHLGYLINIFENNDVIYSVTYEQDPQRLNLVYDEILSIGKKRGINWLHYVNASYLGNETEIFRNNFFHYVSEKIKFKWIKYLFAHNNLVYHGTVLFEDYEDKYKLKKPITNEKALNLEFIEFIVNDIINYLKEKNINMNSVQIKKLHMFKNSLDKIAKNIFLFENVMGVQTLSQIIHEWELNRVLEKKNKISQLQKLEDRKKKKI